MRMNKNSARLLAGALTICLSAGIFSGCGRDNADEQAAGLVSLQSVVSYYEETQKLSDWEELLSLYGATQADGIRVDWNRISMPPAPELDETPSSLADTVLYNMIRGTYDKALVQKLANLQDPAAGGFDASLSGHIWSMLAMNVASGSDNYNYEGAVTYLLQYQSEDGGFAEIAGSEKGDIRLSGLAAVALSPYSRTNTDNANVALLVDYLKKAQTKSGGYKDGEGEGEGEESPVAVSHAIWGLTALGELLPEKKGKSPLDALLDYQNKDGSFQAADGKKGQGDPESTWCAAMALSDIVNGVSTFDMLSSDAQGYRLEHTSGPSITVKIDYPYESDRKDSSETVMVNDGSNALTATLFYGKYADIPMDYIGTAKAGHLTAINGVTEKTFGPESGWYCLVNDLPLTNPADYVMQEGDVLSWNYEKTPSFPLSTTTGGASMTQ